MRHFFLVFAALFCVSVCAAQSSNTGVQLGMNMPQADISDLMFISDTIAGAYGFYENRNVFFRGGVFSPFIKPEIGINLCIKVSHAPHGSFTLVSSYTWNINETGLSPKSMYSGLIFSQRFIAAEGLFTQLYITGEYTGTEQLACVDAMFRFGVKFYPQTNPFSRFDFLINPYGFNYTERFETLAAGLGLDASFTSLTFAAAGFSGGFSTRYAGYNSGKGTYLYKYDGYRGILPKTQSNFVFAAHGEAFFYSGETDFAIPQLLDIFKIKLGLFVNTAYVDKSYTCVGGFTRISLSFIGLDSITVETAAGWDYEAKEVFVNFAFIAKW